MGAEVQNQYAPVCCYCANYALCVDIHIIVVNKIIFIKHETVDLLEMA